MPTDPVFVYMTASSQDEAEQIAGVLVEAKLAACVNILPGMRSVYVWEGQVQQDEECVLIAKTRQDLVPTLTAMVVEQHSYDIPCVVSLPITGGNQDFLQWIAEETAKKH